MKLCLLVLSQGKSEGKAIPITLSQFVIGRDSQCHLRPASAAISKRHCAILVRGSKVFVRDFESTNGTFVNDEPVKGERELAHNDSLKVGPLSFTVQIEQSVPVSKPTPPPPVSKVTENSDDESVAAMLLSIQDETTGAENAEVDSQGVPTGSTVMNIPVALGGESDPGSGDSKAQPTKPVAAANTSSAAKAILEKYMRRPRT